LEKVALQPSTPAGGGVAALSAASAAALAEMTANLTMRKTHDEKSFGQLKSISNLCSGYRVNFLNDIDRDSSQVQISV
jgi:formiminotetrahydrofolate cyclodeaminase